MTLTSSRRTSLPTRALPVRAQPGLPIELAFGKGPPGPGLPYPLSEPGTILTYSGTAAIYQGFRALELPPGSTVLCPSYNCGHEIEPILRLGLGVECYRVARNLDIDLDDVERRLRAGARALLVTHYFGFAQPLGELRALCDRYGAMLVEDCAHALLSNNAERTLGRVGDVAIYSMRKIVPIPNGGAVVFNRPTIVMRGKLEPPPRLSTWMKSLELTAKATLDRFSAGRAPRDLLWLLALLPLFAGSRAVAAVHPRASIAFYNPDDDDFAFDIRIMSWAISKLSLRLMQRIDWSENAARCRRNYRYLLESLDAAPGWRVLLPTLPDSTCPLYMPLWVDRPEDLYGRLAAQRIYGEELWRQEHPAVDWASYPEARELKRHVFALPVHQDIDERALDRLIAALRAE
jgi:dTDP-4-amino-4,6-dideoxygalactose transaminase